MSKPWHVHRARLASLAAHGAAPDDPRIAEERAAMRAALIADKTDATIDDLIMAAPRLTDAQIQRLRALLPAPTLSELDEAA